MLQDKVEAVWAGLIDWRYLSRQPLPPADDWKGPVRGPLRSAAKWLDDAVDLVRRGQFATPEAVCLDQLMLYVTARPDAFKDWRRFAIRRLAKLYLLTLRITWVRRYRTRCWTPTLSTTRGRPPR